MLQCSIKAWRNGTDEFIRRNLKSEIQFNQESSEMMTAGEREGSFQTMIAIPPVVWVWKLKLANKKFLLFYSFTLIQRFLSKTVSFFTFNICCFLIDSAWIYMTRLTYHVNKCSKLPSLCFLDSASLSKHVYERSSKLKNEKVTHSISLIFNKAPAAIFENGGTLPVSPIMNSARSF